MKIALDVRIAQFPGCKTRGIGYFTKNLVNSLTVFDDKNEYFIIGYNGVRKFLGLDSDIANFYEIFSFIKPAFYEYFCRHIKYFEGRYFNYIIKKNKIDLLLTFSSGEKNYIIKTNQICKTVKIFYDLIPLVFKKMYLKNTYEKKIFFDSLKAFEDSTAIISISENSKNDLLKYINFSEQKVFSVYPGVSPLFSHMKDVEIMKVKNKYAIKDKYVIYVGGYDFRKNISRIIEAFSRLSVNILDKCQLVLCGSINDNEKKAVIKTAKEFSVYENIVLTSFVSDFDLACLYSGAEALVFPSLYEGFGLPVIEAMACECPVITSNNSSLYEIASGAAILVNPYDVNQISNSMMRLITNIELRTDLIKKSNECIKKFSWKNAALKTINIFEKI